MALFCFFLTQLPEEYESSEENRVKERLGQLGPHRLQQMEAELKSAQLLRDQPIPASLKASVPYPTVQVPNLPAIRNFHPKIINDAGFKFANSGVGFVDVEQVPFPFQFSAVEGRFTHILVSITTQVGHSANEGKISQPYMFITCFPYKLKQVKVYFVFLLLLFLFTMLKDKNKPTNLILH